MPDLTSNDYTVQRATNSRLVVMMAPNRGEGGYILVGVIALLGVVMTVTAALLSMTLTATRLSEKTRMSAAVVSAADSALEQAVAEMRRNDAVLSPTRADVDGGTANCPGASAHGASHPKSYEFTISATIEDTWTVVVDCETVTPIGDSRDVSLRAFLTSGPGVGSGSGVLGATRVVITDRTASHESPGHRMRICDWQLGQAVAASLSSC
ncbi:MAG: hypothetical protein V9F03_01985 [Microthrixaceae bacterium]